MADSANPYLQPSIDAALGDTVRAYNLSVAPAFTTAMVNSGSFGNQGVAQMQGEAQRQLQQSLGRQANDMRYGDFWQNQNFERGLFNDAFAQNQQQLSNLPGLMSMLGGANSQDLTNATTVQNAPLNYYQQFANTANGIASGFGSQSSSVNMPSSPLLGALGGAQLGSKFGQWAQSKSLGGGSASSMGGSAGMDNIDVGGGWSPAW